MRHSSYLEVNLDILSQNFQKIQGMAPKATILPMVKAEAYGHGLVPVSRFLSEECDVKKLGCARLSEAVRVFNECPDLDSEFLIFSDTELNNEETRKAYLNLRVSPVLHKKSDLEIVLSHPDLKTIPVVLKINTGMNRLGLSLEELAEYAPKLRSRGVQHLISHFACSNYPLKPGDKTHRQFDEFLKAKKILSDANVEVRETSVSNSGAIEQGFGVSETYVRPGVLLYGVPSTPTTPWGGLQVSRLLTKVLKTFSVRKGIPVGYGVYVTGEDVFMVIIPIGYGDGLSTFTSGVEINVNGHKGKVFGRVNMDMIYLAFDPSVEGKIKEGDELEIWGHDYRRILDMSAQMKTIPYQLMCGISARIPRIYKVK